jgi:hypothetical protein
MAEKPRATLADYVVIALSPALIMGLVGTLVFFLLEVFYRGQYGSNLRWILFFYVFGAVLAARIMLMGEIANRGGMYAGVLGILTWLGSLRFADMPDTPVAEFAPLINLFLVVLIWWCSYKLVMDCTNIDDKTDIDAAGLLEASGLEEHEQKAVPAGDAEDGQKKKGWISRWFAYEEQRKKKRTPGVWVVYFSLAALPLFGLGQAFIPPDATERREYTFWLLVLYLACGLGLLLTTCFLGLRRYLRQRKLKMPPAMAGAWLAIGAAIVVGLLGVVALVPRPEAGYSVLKESSDGPDRQASNNAVVKDGKGKDSQNPTGKQEKDAQPGDKRDKDASGKDKDQGKGEKDGQKDKGNGDKDKKDQGGNQKDGPKSGKDDGQKKEGEKEPSGGRQPMLQGLSNFFQGIGPWLKWIVFAILAVIVLVWLLRGGLRYLANFTEWARKLLEWFRNLWASLFGGGSESEKGEGDKPKPAPARAYKSYPDPFLTGAAASMDAREMVRYTFAALQAWGREHGVERRTDETPLEYAARVAALLPDLKTDIRKLASLYARAAYGFAPLPEATEDFLREFWQALDQAANVFTTETPRAQRKQKAKT